MSPGSEKQPNGVVVRSVTPVPPLAVGCCGLYVYWAATVETATTKATVDERKCILCIGLLCLRSLDEDAKKIEEEESECSIQESARDLLDLASICLVRREVAVSSQKSVHK